MIDVHLTDILTQAELDEYNRYRDAAAPKPYTDDEIALLNDIQHASELDIRDYYDAELEGRN